MKQVERQRLYRAKIKAKKRLAAARKAAVDSLTIDALRLWYRDMPREERIACHFKPEYRTAINRLCASSVATDIIDNYDGSWLNETLRSPDDEGVGV